MSRKRAHYPPPPPVPGYHWVQKKDGSGHWRKDCVTRPLNEVMKRNAANTAATNLAANSVMERLQTFTEHLQCGHVHALVAGAFKKSLVQDGEMNYTYLQQLDFQAGSYPYNKLAKGIPQVQVKNGRLHLRLAIGEGFVKRHSKLAEGFVVELILLTGDPGKESDLRIDSIASPDYSFEVKLLPMTECLLSIDLPAKQNWIALLRVGCTGRYVWNMPKYNAMKVLRVGNGYRIAGPVS